MKKSYNKSSRKHQTSLSGVLTVTAEECGGNVDKMIRRFIKKEKIEGIVEEYRSRTHFVKPSDVKREERRQVKRLIEKVNRQRRELFKPRDQRLKKSRTRRS
jgi:ribosomal protein S21